MNFRILWEKQTQYVLVLLLSLNILESLIYAKPVDITRYVQLILYKLYLYEWWQQVVKIGNWQEAGLVFNYVSDELDHFTPCKFAQLTGLISYLAYYSLGCFRLPVYEFSQKAMEITLEVLST
eukprot:TRINITY_DN11844_c0_g3_i1.p5 TRINITY_DN11844_c0_g3~~TRINITY_DN11844_c0_g3_i1.p5  ORF type:complete len:123 (-),score=0.93 TRINITY_DN11844_c0_g3_i1:1619-1987(-)